MSIKKFIAHMMSLCMVLTAILPYMNVAAAGTEPVTHSIKLKDSKHGALSFYPENEELEEEKERSFGEGEDAFFIIAPEEGYVLSDISLKSEEKETDTPVFSVEERGDIIAIQGVDKDYEIEATFEKGKLGKDETLASHAVAKHDEKLAKAKEEAEKEAAKAAEKEQATEAPAEKATEAPAEEKATEAPEEASTAKQEEVKEEAQEVETEEPAEEAEIPEQVTEVKTEDKEEVPVMDDTNNVSEDENLTQKEVAENTLEEEKDLDEFLDGKKASKYNLFVRYTFVESAKAKEGMKINDFKGENQDKLLDMLVTMQDDTIPLYEVKGDDDHYYAYPGINDKKENITFYDMETAFNNDQAEMIDNFEYDKETGVYKISKEYFTEENEKKYEGVPIVRAQALVAYDEKESSQDGISVHVENERDDVEVVNKDQVILSDVLDCQVSIPLVTPETAKNIDLGNLLIILNGETYIDYEKSENQVAFDENGVLGFTCNVMSLKKVDVIIMKEKWDNFNTEKFNKTTKSIDSLSCVKNKSGKDLTFKEDIAKIVNRKDGRYDVKVQFNYVDYHEFTKNDSNNTWQSRIKSMMDELYGVGVGNDQKAWKYIHDTKGVAKDKETFHDYFSSETMRSDFNDYGNSKYNGYLAKFMNYRFLLKDFKAGSGNIDFRQLNQAKNPGTYTLCCAAISTKLAPKSERISRSEGKWRNINTKVKVVYINEKGKYFLLGMVTPGINNTKDGEDVWQSGYGVYKFKYTEEKEGRITVHKTVDGKTSVSAPYSLAGIVFTVRDSNKKVVDTITTNASGYGTSKLLDAGTYTVEETTVPAATFLIKNNSPKTIKVNDGATSDVYMNNDKKPSKVNFTIEKVLPENEVLNDEERRAIEETVFTAKYYKTNYYNRDTLPAKPDSTQDFRVAEIPKGSGKFIARIQRDYEPGTLLIEETATGEGISKVSYEITGENNKDEGKGILVHLKPGDAKSIKGNANFKVKDDTIGADIEFKKVSENGEIMPNVEFKLTNTSTGENYKITTDKNGEYNSQKAKDVWFNKTKEGFDTGHTRNRGALTTGDYELEELRSEANVNHQLVTETFTITKEDEGKVIPIPREGKNGNSAGTIVDEEIKIKTTARDEATGNNYAKQQDILTVIDEVEYDGLVPGQTYTMKGVLMEKEDGKETGKELLVNGHKVEAKRTFEAEAKTGKISLTFTFDAKGLNGKELVVFESCIENDIEIAYHKDINDKGQTIHIPEIKTTAKDKGTVTKDMSYEDSEIKEVTLVDTVSYKNLEPGKEHVLKGVLMNRKTEEKVLDKDGKEITAEHKFTPQTKDGETTVEFVFSVKGLENADYVVFEDVYKNEDLFATHADIKDYGQTVHVPDAHTQAHDGQTNNHSGEIGNNVTIVDKVYYENLEKGKAYKVSGSLRYKDGDDAGKEFTGNGATAAGWFIAGEDTVADPTDVTEDKNTDGAKTRARENGEDSSERVSGFVDLSFTINSSDLEGKSLVVFEDILREGRKVATHADLSDEEQTIHYPKIRTKAHEADSDEQILVSGDSVELVDTVSYENLVPGTEYILTGKLMDKESKQPLTDAEGKEITGQAELIPEEANGTKDVVFKFDTSALEGTRIVVFEKLFTNEVEIARHEDITDVDQTVYIPKIGTSAIDSETKTDTACNDGEITIIDTVKYENLLPNVEYTIKGTLMDKETEQPAKDANGKEITAVSEPFTPQGEKGERVSGSTTVTFTFKTNKETAGTMVAFEKLIHRDKVYCVHENIEDQEQTVYIPKIGTTATDSDTLQHTAGADDSVTINDVVAYSNLQKGKTYTMRGVLMNKETGTPIKDDKGQEITAEREFVAGDEAATESEEQTKTDEEQSAEGETSDASQTETEQGTSDNQGTSETGDKTEEEESIPRYTGNPAERASGTVKLSFTFKASTLMGQTVVAFERVYDEDRLVAVHTDIKDEEQSVHFPRIGTTAAVKKDGKGGDKINCTNKNITMYDVVEYKNLVPDVEYRLVATLINKDTKKAITKTEKTFTPDKANGKVNVPLKFNPSKFAGKDLVVFERLYATSDQVKDKEKLFIAGHEDLKDEGQTVHVKKPTPGSDKKGPGKVQTGDTMKLYYLLGGAVVLIGAACVILFKKKRPTEQ